MYVCNSLLWRRSAARIAAEIPQIMRLASLLPPSGACLKGTSQVSPHATELALKAACFLRHANFSSLLKTCSKVLTRRSRWSRTCASLAQCIDDILVVLLVTNGGLRWCFCWKGRRLRVGSQYGAFVQSDPSMVSRKARHMRGMLYEPVEEESVYSEYVRGISCDLE